MKASELLKLLKKNGWYEARQKGSHIIMRHPGREGILIVPFHGGKEIPKGTLLIILKEANIKK